MLGPAQYLTLLTFTGAPSIITSFPIFSSLLGHSNGRRGTCCFVLRIWSFLTCPLSTNIHKQTFKRSRIVLMILLVRLGPGEPNPARRQASFSLSQPREIINEGCSICIRLCLFPSRHLDRLPNSSQNTMNPVCGGQCQMVDQTKVDCSESFEPAGHK